MPIPNKVSNDFFVPPINPFFIEDDNEAVIIDESIYDYELFMLSFDSFIVDFDSDGFQENEAINIFANSSSLSTIIFDLDIYRIEDLSDKLITNKRDEIHNKLIKQKRRNSKQKCLKSKEFEYIFLSNGIE